MPTSSERRSLKYFVLFNYLYISPPGPAESRHGSDHPGGGLDSGHLGLHPAGALLLPVSACLSGQWAGCLDTGLLTSTGGRGHQSGPGQAEAGAQLRQPREGGDSARSQGPVIKWIGMFVFIGSGHEAPGLMIPVVRPKPLRTDAHNQVCRLLVLSSFLTVTQKQMQNFILDNGEKYQQTL